MAVIKDEDFVDYPVIMEGMLNESLCLFCTRFNYGANFHDMFHELFQYGYIYKGSIIRRWPGDGRIESEELYFAINLDAMPSPIEIPSEVWKYAFEIPSKSSLPFRIRPDTTVKVALFSVQAGFVLIAPISLLLLVCQQQVPVQMIREGTIAGLARDWDQAYGLLNNCAAFLGETPDRSPAAAVSHLNLCLYLPSENVVSLLDIVARYDPHPLKDFVDEFWTLSIPKFDRRKGIYASGNAFSWISSYLRESRKGFIAEWITSPRVRRCSHLGERYAVNFEYLERGNKPSSMASWQTAKLVLFDPSRGPKPNAASLRDEQEYSVRELPYAPIPTIVKHYPRSSALRAFATFYRDQYNRLLKVIEWHGPYLLLREAEVYDNARETKEAMEKWAKKVTAAKVEQAAKLAKQGKAVPELGPGEVKPPAAQPLVLSVKQQEEVRNFLKHLEDLWDRVNDLIDVKSRTGYTEQEMYALFEDLVFARAEVDRMAKAGYKMFEIDAAFYPAFDKFENFVTPRRMDEWYFGNVPPVKDGAKGNESGSAHAVHVEENIFKDIIVQDLGSDFLDQEHIAGVQTFLSLATASGRPTRFFSINPENTIQEERLDFLQDATREWLAKALVVLRDIACRVLTLMEDNLNLGLMWGDVLANDHLQARRKSPDAAQFIVARWRYVPASEMYVRFTEDELRLYITLVKRTLEAPATMSATVEHLQWELLRKKDPAGYAQIAKELEEIQETIPMSDEQIESEREEEEAADELPEDMRDDRENWDIIKETDAWIKYRRPDGSIVIEPTDLAREAEAFKREYLDEEDEDEED